MEIDIDAVFDVAGDVISDLSEYFFQPFLNDHPIQVAW